MQPHINFLIPGIDASHSSSGEEQSSMPGNFYFMEPWQNNSLIDLTEVFEGVYYLEEWRDIFTFEEQYRVSSFGRIKSLLRVYYAGHSNKQAKIAPEKICKQVQDKRGYCRVSLSSNSYDKLYSVHRLVAEEFIPNPERKKTVNHKKGVKTDNRVHQIEWNTYKENNDHALNTGIPRGFITDKTVNQKLPLDKIIYIFNSNKSGVELAREFDVTPTTISGIKTGKSYSHITGKLYKKYGT